MSAEIIFQDVVYRKDVFNALELSDFTQDKEYEDGARLIFEESLKERLDEIPIVVPSLPWIPVSMELPEEGEPVLGWIERDSWGEEDEPERVREHAIGWHVNGLWHFDGYMSKGTDCLAWMPLPDPYGEDE